jgi:TonB family protein
VASSRVRFALLVVLVACACACDDEEGYPPNAPSNDMTEVAPATPQEGSTTSAPSQPPPGTPQPLGQAWAVPFPEEAAQAGIQSAEVVLVVTVAPSGTVEDAAVVTDPGHGFGPAARTYALGQRFKPALDASGTAIRASTRMKVRFHAQGGAAPSSP